MFYFTIYYLIFVIFPSRYARSFRKKMRDEKITMRDNRIVFSQEQDRIAEYILLSSLLPESRTLVSPWPRYVSNYPYNRKWRQLYTYQVSCYEAPKNGVRYENGAVNYNASSPRTIMPPQYSFLATMGVALMGVRLQRVSIETTFTTRFSRACKQQPWSLSLSSRLFPGRIYWMKKKKKKRYSSLCLQRQDFEMRNGQVAERSQRASVVLFAGKSRVSIVECNL